MVQTMSISAIVTLIAYFVMSRVFNRPIPTLQLQDPTPHLRRRKRRPTRESSSEPGSHGSIALPPARTQPVEDYIQPKRTRSKAR